MSNRLPRIGVTLDAEPPSETPDGYSRYPWYALRQNYAGAIEAAFGRGQYELADLITALNASRVRPQQGGMWTEENFTTLMHELGA